MQSSLLIVAKAELQLVLSQNAAVESSWHSDSQQRIQSPFVQHTSKAAISNVCQVACIRHLLATSMQPDILVMLCHACMKWHQPLCWCMMRWVKYVVMLGVLGWAVVCHHHRCSQHAV